MADPQTHPPTAPRQRHNDVHFQLPEQGIGPEYFGNAVLNAGYFFGSFFIRLLSGGFILWVFIIQGNRKVLLGQLAAGE
jgi:hypothetical protein